MWPRLTRYEQYDIRRAWKLIQNNGGSLFNLCQDRSQSEQHTKLTQRIGNSNKSKRFK